MDLAELQPNLMPVLPYMKQYGLTVPNVVEKFVRAKLDGFDWAVVSHDSIVPWLHVDPSNRVFLPELNENVSGGRLALSMVSVCKRIAWESGENVALLGSEEKDTLEIWYCGVYPERHKLLMRIPPMSMHRFVNTIVFARW